MRILYVSPYYKPAYVYGGPVQCIASLCEGLAQAGTDMTVFTTDANGAKRLDVPLQQAVPMDGVTIWYYPLVLNGLSFFYSPSLARAVRARIPEFDLVIIGSLWGHALVPAARACLRSQVPYIIPTHGQLFPWALESKKLKKTLYLKLVARRYIDRAAALHCTDPLEAEAVSSLQFRPPVFVVPNALPAAGVNEAQNHGDMRREWGIPMDATVMLFLGRLARIKGPEIAVGTLAAAQALGREVHLVMVGPDEEGLAAELQAQAQASGCAERLHLTGLLDRQAVARVLNDVDLLVMPSLVQENFGLAALEASAAGVPVLTSEGVPTGRWAQTVGAGRAVACSQAAFSQAAIELLSHPELLSAMGQRGETMARQCFDIAVVARQMLRQCEAIVATGQPVAAKQPDHFGAEKGAVPVIAGPPEAAPSGVIAEQREQQL